MGKTFSSGEIIKEIQADGWYLAQIVGDHHQYKHPEKKGRVTIQHPKKTLSKFVVASIERQSGLKF